MKNLLDSTMERISAIENARAEKITKIALEIETTYSAIESQRKRVTDAAASADLETYRREQVKLRELQENKATLEQWQADHNKAPKVAEAESENTIAALLAYEASLEADYRAAAGKLFMALKALTDKHMEEARAAERVLTAWTTKIRANYKSSNYINGSTRCEDGMYKSNKPVPIHPLEYYGWRDVPYILSLYKTDAVKDLLKAAREEENGT